MAELGPDRPILVIQVKRSSHEYEAVNGSVADTENLAPQELLTTEQRTDETPNLFAAGHEVQSRTRTRLQVLAKMGKSVLEPEHVLEPAILSRSGDGKIHYSPHLDSLNSVLFSLLRLFSPHFHNTILQAVCLGFRHYTLVLLTFPFNLYCPS